MSVLCVNQDQTADVHTLAGVWFCIHVCLICISVSAYFLTFPPVLIHAVSWQSFDTRTHFYSFQLLLDAVLNQLVDQPEAKQHNVFL